MRAIDGLGVGGVDVGGTSGVGSVGSVDGAGVSSAGTIDDSARAAAPAGGTLVGRFSIETEHC